MFETFRLKQELKRIELNNKLHEQKIIAESIRDVERLKKQFEDEDEAKWMELGNNEEKQLSESDHFDLIRQAQKFYFKNSHARGIIRLYEKYVTGRGFQIHPKTDNELWLETWKAFQKKNKMSRKRKEIIRRAIRDGEVFIRFFYGVDGTVKIRFMNPLKVKDPDDKDSYGIRTNPDDIEDVKGYHYGSDFVPSEEVIHEKLFVDSDVKRGRTVLEPIAKPLAQYPGWITDRMKAHKIRTVMALIKKVKGTTAQVRNIAGQNATTQRRAPDGSEYARLPEGVSIITTKPSVDYEFKTPNMQANDAQHDGYALLNMIAAGPGIPNWMVSSDPSNANYASSLVSEAPGVKEFQDWQDFFQDTFESIYEKVMEHALKSGNIPKFEEVTTVEVDSKTGEQKEITEMQEIKIEAHIVFPELVHREILTETKALGMQRGEGAISLRTYSGKLDLDYDSEQEMIQQEGEEGREDEEDEDVNDREAEESFKKARKQYISGGK